MRCYCDFTYLELGLCLPVFYTMLDPFHYKNEIAKLSFLNKSVLIEWPRMNLEQCQTRFCLPKHNTQIGLFVKCRNPVLNL